MDGFDKVCKKIEASYLKVGDKSMIDINFRTTTKGDSPKLSHILCMPEPIGI